MVWRIDGPQGNEAAKIKHEIVRFTRGHGLDLGCGPNKAFPHFIGVDSCVDTELFGIQMKPDIRIESCEALNIFETGACDFVFSSHLLEHLTDYKAALREWWRVLKVGGHMVLYLPHKDLYPNCGEEGANPDHKHDFEPCDISNALRELGVDADLVVNQVRDGGDEYSFLQVWKKLPEKSGFKASWMTTKTNRKTVCVVRYGGFGDMIQAACILPALKRQGFRVTVMTTPKGQSILEHDPNIDEFFVQDEDQVPNHELYDFWTVQAQHYDKFINLSESIEGTLLAIPGRAQFVWPHDIRHKYMNRNYHEWTAELAGVPFAPDGFFYPSDDEREAAKEVLRDGKYNIVFALSGSSIHKFYPWQDAVIARVMQELPEAVIYTTGDEACKILEAGWENEARVVMLAGEQSIRETLTLAKLSNCVVGPETGVLNAVGFEEGIRKVCLLSHSSIENLTKHWTNTVSAIPHRSILCHPCHQLHYDRRCCPEHKETGAAMCSVSIDPELVFEAIQHDYNRWTKKNEPVRTEIHVPA